MTSKAIQKLHKVLNKGITLKTTSTSFIDLKKIIELPKKFQNPLTPNGNGLDREKSKNEHAM